MRLKSAKRPREKIFVSSIPIEAESQIAFIGGVISARPMRTRFLSGPHIQHRASGQLTFFSPVRCGRGKTLVLPCVIG